MGDVVEIDTTSGDTIDVYYKYFNPAEMNDGSGQIDWTQVIDTGPLIMNLTLLTVLQCIAQNEL